MKRISSGGARTDEPTPGVYDIWDLFPLQTNGTVFKTVWQKYSLENRQRAGKWSTQIQNISRFGDLDTREKTQKTTTTTTTNPDPRDHPKAIKMCLKFTYGSIPYFPQWSTLSSLLRTCQHRLFVLSQNPHWGTAGAQTDWESRTITNSRSSQERVKKKKVSLASPATRKSVRVMSAFPAHSASFMSQPSSNIR